VKILTPMFGIYSETVWVIYTETEDEEKRSRGDRITEMDWIWLFGSNACPIFLQFNLFLKKIYVCFL